ncbi:MAG: P-loop NTPase [Planctomycetes bacterium]|nr:P-loop NTPase [Planctomycetota bacterium]
MVFFKLVRGLRRHWLFIVLLGLIAAGAQELWIRAGGPPKYAAETIVHLEPESALEIGPREPAAKAAVSASEQGCWPVLERAARSLLQGEEPESIPLPSPEQAQTLRYVREQLSTVLGDDAEAVKRLAERLERSIEVHLEGNEGPLKFRALSNDPEEALVFSWTAAQAAKACHDDQVQQLVIGRLAGLRGQRDELERSWRQLSQERLESLKKLGVADFSRREQALRNWLGEIEQELRRLEAEKATLSRLIDDEEVARIYLERSLEEKDREALSLEELEKQFQEAHLEYDVQAAQLTEWHPKVVGLKEKVHRLELQVNQRRMEPSSRPLDAEGKETHEQLLARHKVIAIRLETAGKERQSLYKELLDLEDLRPQIAGLDEALAQTERKLKRIRGQIDDLELASMGGARPAWRVLPAWKADPLEKFGIGPAWRAGVLLTGLALGCLLAWFFELLSTQLRSEREVHLFLQLPLLAMIPRMGRKERHALEPGPKGRARECFNAAATVIRSVSKELKMRAFAVSSANPGEGKTTVAIHLAAALARKGLKVCLVDGDLRQPSVHHLLGLSNETGLASILEEEADGGGRTSPAPGKGGEEPWAEKLEKAFQLSALKNLHVLTSGPPCRSPVAAIEGAKMVRVLNWLTREMDFVVIDTPAVQRAGEALALVAMADACLFVVGAGQCDYPDALWAKHLFANVGASVLGVILNRCGPEAGGGRGVVGLEPFNQNLVEAST